MSKLQRMTFAQTIRAYRESVGLTQAELAHKLTVSSQTVNNWETGRVEPWPRRKEALLDQIGVKLQHMPIREGETNSFPKHYRQHELWDRAHGICEGESAPVYQRKRQPNVCEEITGEGPAGSQESVEKPQIDFRRPPPHS